MFKNEKTKNIMLAILAVCLISLTVVYATLSQDLKISGVATVKKGEWNIHFTKLQTPKAEGDATAGKAVLNGDSTVITISDGAFSAPGDKITYEFDVINEGDIDAEVELTSTAMENCKAADNSDITNFCNKIGFELFYKDTKIPVAKGDKLLGKEEKTLNLVITYDKNRELTSLPKSPITLSTITSIINYKMIEPQKTTPSTPSEDTNTVLTTFSTDSWDTIAENVRNGKKYRIGDTKKVDMGSFGTHRVRVANTTSSNTISKAKSKKSIISKAAADVNQTVYDDASKCGTAGFSETACGFVVEFADIITKHVMNSTDTNKDGWPATEMRTYVNNDIYNALPSNLKKNIIDTTVISGHGSGVLCESSGESSSENSSESSGESNCTDYEQNDNFTSTDKLYLLSTKEIYGEAYEYDTVNGETRQLDYYKEKGVTSSNYQAVIKKSNNYNAYWWLRSANSYGNGTFLDVEDSGDCFNYSAIGSHGISPAFRIG